MVNRQPDDAAQRSGLAGAAHVQPLTIAVTGASGLLGRSLFPFLAAGGHRLRRVVRGSPGPGEIAWNPAEGKFDASALEGTDAVIHLAGEPIAGGRWNAARRQRILESRTLPTMLLSERLAGLSRPPRVLVSASAIGIYGDRGDEVLDETTSLRTGAEAGFLEQVAHAWEAATEPAARAGIRVVRLRIGLVLSPAGGALKPVLIPFRLGLGGRLGGGRQYMSWISMDDLLGAIHHALVTEALQGPVNATGPEPVTNVEFTRVLARVLRRPAPFPVPASILRMLLGQMADELLLSSARALPRQLLRTGYVFRHQTLEIALRHLLGRSA